MLQCLAVVLLWCAVSQGVHGATLQQWRSRTVYQVITDRFAPTDGWGKPCKDVHKYCGGTFKGLVTRQSYIEDLGFDAIWMSPIFAQGSEMMGNEGYHGYWPADFYKVNPSFGTGGDLQALMEAYRSKGMYVMFDMVINHVGYGDYTTFNPFNLQEYFHDCEGCTGMYCEVSPDGPFTSPKAAYAYEHCKLSGLPDLNHTSPRVLELMKGVFDYTLDEYGPDGLRLDAAGHSDLNFCADITRHVSNQSWTVGELFLVDNISHSIATHADYVRKGAGSVFGFPMAIVLAKVLRESRHDMLWLAERRAEWLSIMGDRVHDTMTFADNHDLPRWLNTYNGYTSLSRFKNALAFVLFTEGIPVIYYGTEQGFSDSHSFRADPRNPLWGSEYSHDHPLWLFLRISIAYRKEARVWDAGIAQQLFVNSSKLVLSRGPFVLVLSNVAEWDAKGKSPADMVTLQGPLPEQFRGKTLTNIYNSQDKLSVSNGGVGLYTPDPEGAPQVFYLGSVAPPSSFYKPARKASYLASSIVFASFLVAYALMPVVLLLVLKHMRRPATSSRHDLTAPCSGLLVPCHGWLSDTPNSSGHGGHSAGQQGTGGVSMTVPAVSGSLSQLSASTAMGVTPALYRQALGSLAGSTSMPVSAMRDNPSLVLSGLQRAAHANEPAASTSTASSSPTTNSVQHNRAVTFRIDAEGPKVIPAFAGTHTASTASGSAVAAQHAGPSMSSAPAQVPVCEHDYHTLCSSSFTSNRSSNASSVGSSKAHTVATDGFACEIEVNSLASGAHSCYPDGQAADACSTSSQDVVDAASDVAAAADVTPSHPRGAGRAQGHWNSRSSVSVSPFSSVQTPPLVPEGYPPVTQTKAPQTAGFDPATHPILHVALEYSLPHLGLSNQLMYGGMGLVVGTFLQHWPGPMALCAPLYKPCYNIEGSDGAERPFFVPPGQSPLLALTVDVARGWQLPVEVFKVTAQVQQGPAAGQDRTYYLIQSELFRHRSRSGLYSFRDESEMLTWLAVFNKAVAAVVLAEGYQQVQLHDYHGALSLMYMPKELRPAVVYVAHNAHYDARFPIPTPARKQQVYELLNLTPDASAYIEHNGCVDILRPAVVHFRNCQQGRGVIAVSPRYASQVSKKLSCFWSLSPVGRPRSIIGILNSLDMKDSLAAEGRPLREVLSIKAAAKERLQLQHSLSVGQQYSLATFVGRMTQQKGCDIIAEVAQGLMDRHPYLQLVVLGPAGDPVGSAASQRLWQLSAQYPDRMYCPVDHYVAGQEKELLLQATDFCLLPSRFEPCGLVDVEFGWNGSMIIGHDTGGLGKMPGVYFSAQATHLEHLSRKFEEAVDTALALPTPDRHQRMAAALARRFPVPEMMDKYAAAWKEVDSDFKGAQHSRLPAQRRKSRHELFFADQWSRSNQLQQQGTPGISASRSCPALLNLSQAGMLSASDHAATSLASSESLSITPVSSVDAPAASCTDCFKKLAPAAPDCSNSAVSFAGPGTVHPSRADAVSSAQRMTNRLMVVLQPLSLGPGILLLSFLLLQEVLVGSKHVVGMKLQDWVWAAVPQTVGMMAPLVMAFLILSTLAAPFWFWLAVKLRPASYIRVATALVSVSYALSFIALNLTELLSIAAGLTAITNLVTCPFLSLGMMGQEDVHVFKVGRGMMALSETIKYGLLAICLALAATASGSLPHQVLGGLLLLVSGAIALWMFGHGALSDAYRHMSLSMRGQMRFLRHISCFWLSLVAGACDSLSMLLTGFLVVNLTRDLGLLAVFQAIAFGCSAAAVLWNWHSLCSRLAELHLNKAVLLLAGLPFYQAFKAGLLIAGLPVGATLGLCGVIDLLMGGRSSILGLAGFVTLPSREIVTVWQFAGIMTGSVSGIVLLGGAYAGIQSGVTISSWALFGIITGLELLRTGVAVLLAKYYADENLSAP